MACLNKSRTREAPTPTNISTKSEPDREKKGTCASPATAFANKVLPVPGGPTNNAPFGILPPRFVYLRGFFKKSTISITSCFASSKPATSLKVILICDSLSNNCALDLPILNIAPPPPPAPPPIRRIKKIQIAANTNNGNINVTNQLAQGLERSAYFNCTLGVPGASSACDAVNFFSRTSAEASLKIYCGPVSS
ncbi:hypothetical protein D3C86_806540 [compost metagenome]